MEIFTLLEELEDLLESSRNLPFSAKTIVNKEEMLDLIKEIRLKMPDELKQAKWVKEERQRILSEAESRAETIQKNAEETQMQLIDEHEITKAAYEQANELVNAAQQKSIEIKTDTDQYVDDVLNDVEHRLDLLLRKVREDRGYFNNN